MKISETPKFIFIHIPRTGGSTITAALPGDNHRERGFDHWHIDATYLKNKISNFDEYFTFSFVRNPWDRLYSEYSYNKRYIEKLKLRDTYIPNGVNFFEECDFKTWLLDRKTWQAWDKQKYYKPIQLQTQLGYLSVDGKVVISKFAKFENLQTEYKDICDILKLMPVSLKKLEPSKIRVADYRQAYDQEMIDFVHEKHIEDVTFFDYSF